MLQRLASKHCWTESEHSEVIFLVGVQPFFDHTVRSALSPPHTSRAQVIDFLKSRHFRVGDIGLDLTRKVRRSYTISYYFILFHTISYHFTDQKGAGTYKAYRKKLCVNTEMVTETLITILHEKARNLLRILNEILPERTGPSRKTVTFLYGIFGRLMLSLH